MSGGILCPVVRYMTLTVGTGESAQPLSWTPYFGVLRSPKAVRFKKV